MGYVLSLCAALTAWAFYKGMVDAALGGVIMSMLAGVGYVVGLLNRAFSKK